jgi:para-nitrobenzyl esterase
MQRISVMTVRKFLIPWKRHHKAPPLPQKAVFFLMYGHLQIPRQRRPQSSFGFTAAGSLTEAALLLSAMEVPFPNIARMLSSQGQSIYEYEFRFSYVAQSMRKEWPGGAPHASEVPFVFNTLRQRYGSKATATDKAMARTISGYWTAFAKTGDPNGASRPHWPRYNVKQDVLANFTNKGVIIEPDPWKLRLDLTEGSHQDDQ